MLSGYATQPVALYLDGEYRCLKCGTPHRADPTQTGMCRFCWAGVGDPIHASPAPTEREEG